jgi:hypothetical protein
VTKKRHNDVPRPKSLKVLSDEEHHKRHPKDAARAQDRVENQMALQDAYDRKIDR